MAAYLSACNTIYKERPHIGRTWHPNPQMKLRDIKSVQQIAEWHPHPATATRNSLPACRQHIRVQRTMVSSSSTLPAPTIALCNCCALKGPVCAQVHLQGDRARPLEGITAGARVSKGYVFSDIQQNMVTSHSTYLQLPRQGHNYMQPCRAEHVGLGWLRMSGDF